MSKPVTNTNYRKLRGTDKPFSGSEEQTQAIWNELIRKAKYSRPAPKGAPAGESKPEGGPAGS
jgi:hypothetical protein